VTIIFVSGNQAAVGMVGMRRRISRKNGPARFFCKAETLYKNIASLFMQVDAIDTAEREDRMLSLKIPHLCADRTRNQYCLDKDAERITGRESVAAARM